MKSTMALFVLLLLAGPLWGQQHRHTGLRTSEQRYSQVPLLPVYSGTKYNEIPLKVNLQKYCPIPGDQGENGACVGWAVGYGALTVSRAVRAGITDPAVTTAMANSAAFLYNQVKLKSDDCSYGAYVEDALTLLKERGDCLEKSFNYQQAGDCKTLPAPAHLTEAALYRVKDFATVFSLEEKPRSKIAKACKILATETPLIVGMELTESFWDILPGTRTWQPQPNEANTGKHAMLLVGYDNVERYFVLMNSFGPAWGDHGFIRIPYEAFEQLCRYAYVLVMADGDKAGLVHAPMPGGANADAPHIHIKGELVFRRPAGYLTMADGTELPFFEEVPTKWVAGTFLFEPHQPQFSVGDAFQLVARNIPQGQYAYVFSRDPEGQVRLHFPRLEAQRRTAGFVLSQNSEIVIPDNETILQLAASGTDYLCILYAAQQIPDIEKRLDQLEQATEEAFTEAFYRVFSDRLVPQADIRFNGHKMAFEATLQPGQAQLAVPLVLKVVAQ